MKNIVPSAIVTTVFNGKALSPKATQYLNAQMKGRKTHNYHYIRFITEYKISHKAGQDALA